ncbi:MAG TPA: hypothetical protein VN783_06385 [Thermoanaerobaculia bacterium]|nr:hypothetical protein [Thermoanaerobaculia bacterium]
MIRRHVLLSLLVVSSSLLAAAPAKAAPNPRFPSLDAQLRTSPVAIRPESALAKLIAENQDFGLLRPEEAKDLRGLPPWLRVWWHKEHPESVYPPLSEDPTGGYPLVLKEIWEWMLHHQDLLPAEAEPDQAGEETEGDAEGAAIVSGEVRTSGAQATPRSESDIRVNYWDATKIISASNSITGGGHQAIAFSTDSGATWGQTTLPFTGTDASHSDPTVDWTSDGTAWSTTLGIVGGTLRMRTYNSANNGATWAFEATPSAAQTNVDKQMQWVDHSATSPCKDFQYGIWHNGQPAFMSTRNATTNTWGAPIQVSGAESTGTAIGGDAKSNAFGDAFGFWPTTGNARVLVTKSTTCGASWGTPVQVATTFDTFDIGCPSFNSRRALIYISGGAYRTATKNLVYAAWNDLSGEAGCTAPANEPGANAASTCKIRIWFTRSTDGGATWEPKRMINNQASLNDQFNQWLVVDETTGGVGIMYYDTVADAARKKVHVYYQSSFNDGVTFSAPVQVTTAQTDETTGGQDNGNQFGDYNSLSGIAGTFWPAWTDRRSGAREEIWTAKVFDPACTAPGTPTIGAASTPAANQIQVSWTNGAPPSTLFNVYRAVGTCAAPGPFSRIATGVAASPYLDTTVSGAITYAYRVAGTEATGACESAQSGCVQATATGVCTLPPNFAGLASASNAAVAGCTNNLAWNAATPQCAGPVSYNVYRSTTPGFVPAIGNRIASGISGTGYSDTGPLLNATTYYYKVRAVDGSNSSEETNTVEKSAAPTGPISVGSFTETFETPPGFDNAGWTHQPISGANDWTWSTAQSQTPTHSWNSVSLPTVSDRVLATPSLVAQAGTTLSFFHTFAFEGSVANCFDAGTLEISTDGGTVWTVVPDANFTAGGFNGTVNGGFSNPLAGKRAWCSGTIGALTQVTASLASFSGQSFKLRWHEGDDVSINATGWFVDSVSLGNVGSAGPCTPLPVTLIDFAIE